MHSFNDSPHQLRLVSRDYGGAVFGFLFIFIGLVPWIFPSLQICSDAPDACKFGTPAFVTVGLIALLSIKRYTVILDREQNQMRTTLWRPYRTRIHEAVVSDITGTLEMTAGGEKARKTQLGVLDVNGNCHPVLVPGTPRSRRTRKTAERIRNLLGLEAERSLSSWDLKPSLSELASSMRGVAVQTEEAEALRAALDNNPSDIPSWRQLALRLMRLEKRDEAGDILRRALRHFQDQGAGNDANHIAALIIALGLQSKTKEPTTR